MNLFDILILVAVGSAVVGGYRLGFVTRAASWVGLIVGLVVASRVAPAVVDLAPNAAPANRLLLALVVFLGASFLLQGLGMLIGHSFRRILPPGPLRQADRVGGALAGFAGVLVGVWLLLPAIGEVPGWPAQQARNSQLARSIDSLFPQPPDTLQVLRRLVGPDGIPRVFDALRPAPAIGPPPAASGLSPAVISTVSASTVRVEGIACRRIQDGSGFSAAPDLVVTNAHVVAGERQTTVIRHDGRRLRATVVVFDPDRDLALLRVGGLTQPPLPIGEGREGMTGAVFGHPQGQVPLAVQPAAIRRQVDAVGRDLYDRHQTRRQVFILASDLAPGDSGGALVNQAGAVVGVAFAIAPDRPGTAYALTSAELKAVLAVSRSVPVDTGPCLTST